jgi:hypothetical protein
VRIVAGVLILAAPIGCAGRALPPGSVEAANAAAIKAIDQMQPARGPADLLQADPPIVTFGIVKVGAAAARTVEIRNASGKPVRIAKLDVAGKAFAVDPVSVPKTLDAEARFTVTVHFRPADRCQCAGSLNLHIEGVQKIQAIALGGGGER